MADRYWVGGAGTWDATTTTNWSATSGGSGGASAPTSADNVIFDSASNATAYAVTIGTNAVAQDITIAGPASGSVTITSGATAVINCYGSWTNAATGVVFSATLGAAINFLSTTTGKTITTNNVTLSANLITFSGVNGGWNLGSAFTNTAGFTVNNGSFSTSTSNYALTTTVITTTGTATRSISLNASVVTVSAATAINIANATGLTFNAGTSTITCSNTSPVINGNGQTFYNVTFSSTASGITTIQGVNTFNNLTQTSISGGVAIRRVIFSSNQTITGTLTLGAANTAVRRMQVAPTPVTGTGVGTPVTLTVATIATLSDVDFRDITAAGASGTWSGTRLGNAGGNSNITFATGVNKYWNLAAGGVWSATAWALTSGGTPATNNFPLAQDTVIIEDTGLTAGNTITVNATWYLGTINASTRTTAFTLASGADTPIIVGSYNIPSVATVTGTGAWYFQGNGATQTITTNGDVLPFPIICNGSSTNIVRLIGNLTTTNTATLQQGTLDLNNNVFSATTFTTSAVAHTLAFGTGNLTLTGTGTIFTGSTTTTVTGTPQVICTDSSATARTIIAGAVTESNSISFRVNSGTGSVNFNAGGYKDLDFTDGVNPTGFAGSITGGAISVYGNFKASTGMTVIATTNAITFAATSGTKTINTAGVTFDRPFTFNGIGGTFQLASALTSGSARTCTLTNGTLDLTSYTLTTGQFSSNQSNVRTLAFGTGKMVLTGTNTTVYTTSTATNLTFTGTRTVELTGNGISGETRIVQGPSTGGTASNFANIYVKTGSDTFSMASVARSYGTLDFTGFSGTTISGTTPILYGSLVFSSGMTISGGTGVWTLVATNAQTITTAGQTLDFPITFNGVGGSWSLQDALTIGSTRTLTLTAGTVASNGYTITTGFFSSTGSSNRALSLSNGVISLSSTGTAWTTSGTNFSMGATDRISLSSSTTQTLSGGGVNLGTVSIDNSAAKTITGSNSFYNIVNTVVPATVNFEAASTNTFSNFNLNGATGSLVSLRSTISGTRYNLVKI